MTAVFSKEYVMKRWLRRHGFPADDDSSAGISGLNSLKEEAADEIERRYLSLLETAPAESLPSEDVLQECRREDAPYGGIRLTLPADARRPSYAETASGELITEFYPLEGPLAPSLTLPLTGRRERPTAYWSPRGIVEVYGGKGKTELRSLHAVRRPKDGSYNLPPDLLPRIIEDEEDERG